MFIIGSTTEASACGHAVRVVDCEQCHRSYVFAFEHRAYSSITTYYFIGASTAPQRAQEEAWKRLEEGLESKVVPVPCPACGWYQSNMVEEIRRRTPNPLDPNTIFLIGIGFLSAAFFLIGLLSTLDRPNFQGEEEWSSELIIVLTVAAFTAVTGTIWGWYRYLSRLRKRWTYAANEAIPVDMRIARGLERAMLLKEYERLYGMLPPNSGNTYPTRFPVRTSSQQDLPNPISP